MRPFGSDVQVVVYLATQTPLIGLLQVIYPIVETLGCIWHDTEDSENDTRKSKATNKKNQINQRRRQRHHQQLESVLDYWTLHAAQRLFGAAVSSLPFVSRYILTSTISRVAHLWWSLYVAALLYVSLHHGEHESEATSHQSSRARRTSDDQPLSTVRLLQLPASWLVRRVGAGASELNGIVSVDTWQQLLSVIGPLVNLSVTARLMTTGTRDQVVHFLTELRVIVLPLAMCFAPLVSNWAVLFAQYLIPISKFHGRNAEQKQQKHTKKTPTAENTDDLLDAAQYWVLHVCVAGFVTSFLPFNILRFIAWWYLSWPTTIRWLWSWCGSELVVAVEVLLGEAPPTQSAIGRALHELWQQLPRAKPVYKADGSIESGAQPSFPDAASAPVFGRDDEVFFSPHDTSNRENAPPSITNSEPRRSKRNIKRTPSG